MRFVIVMHNSGTQTVAPVVVYAIQRCCGDSDVIKVLLAILKFSWQLLNTVK